jgi:hypothetical protein
MLSQSASLASDHQPEGHPRRTVALPYGARPSSRTDIVHQRRSQPFRLPQQSWGFGSMLELSRPKSGSLPGLSSVFAADAICTAPISRRRALVCSSSGKDSNPHNTTVSWTCLISGRRGSRFGRTCVGDCARHLSRQTRPAGHRPRRSAPFSKISTNRGLRDAKVPPSHAQKPSSCTPPARAPRSGAHRVGDPSR